MCDNESQKINDNIKQKYEKQLEYAKKYYHKNKEHILEKKKEDNYLDKKKQEYVYLLNNNIRQVREETKKKI